MNKFLNFSLTMALVTCCANAGIVLASETQLPVADATDEEGMTPLMNAAKKGDINAIHNLLKNQSPEDLSCQLKKKNNFGQTALMIAAEEGQVNAVRCLIEYDKRISSSHLGLHDRFGLDAVSFAIINGHRDVIQCFQKKYLRLDQLKYAIKCNRFDIASDLLRNQNILEEIKNKEKLQNETLLDLAQNQPRTKKRDDFIHSLENLEIKNAPRPFAFLAFPSSAEIDSFSKKIKEIKTLGHQENFIKIILGDVGSPIFTFNPHFNGCIFVDPSCTNSCSKNENSYAIRFKGSTYKFYNLLKMNKTLSNELRGNVSLIWDDWGTFQGSLCECCRSSDEKNLTSEEYKNAFECFKNLLMPKGKIIMSAKAYFKLKDKNILLNEDIKKIEVCNQKIGLKYYLFDNYDTDVNNDPIWEPAPKNFGETKITRTGTDFITKKQVHIIERKDLYSMTDKEAIEYPRNPYLRDHDGSIRRDMNGLIILPDQWVRITFNKNTD